MTSQHTTSFSLVDLADSLGISFVVPILVIACCVALRSKSGLRSELSARHVRQEAGGLCIVILILSSGLLLRRDGHLADTKAMISHPTQLKSNRAIIEMRKYWPVLLNPDSLLVLQQLLLALGGVLLLARGACSRGSCLMALALSLLFLAHGARALLWIQLQDYVPEGPVGYDFAAMCAMIAAIALFAAALRATCSAWTRGPKFLGLVAQDHFLCSLVFALTISRWLVKENHMVAAGTEWLDELFNLVDAIGLCAAPIFLNAVLSSATDVPYLGGALASLAAAQLVSLYWFADYVGFLEDPASPDDFVKKNLLLKAQIAELVHGRPYMLMGASQLVQAFSTVTAYIFYANAQADTKTPLKSRCNRK